MPIAMIEVVAGGFPPGNGVFGKVSAANRQSGMRTYQSVIEFGEPNLDMFQVG
jgi:hypothetical protein